MVEHFFKWRSAKGSVANVHTWKTVAHLAMGLSRRTSLCCMSDEHCSPCDQNQLSLVA